MWQHVYGNKKLGSNSRSSRLINSLYPDKKRTLPDMGKEYGMSIKSTISKFKHKGFVIQDIDGSYFLSKIGVWFSISNQLDITFLELCALACACCVQERLASHGKEGFYMLPSFEEVFKRYYTKAHLEVVFVNLRNKFGFRVSKKSLGIYPEVHKRLMTTYGEQFRLLEIWTDEIQEREPEIVSSAINELD